MCAEESILCGASDRWRGESIYDPAAYALVDQLLSDKVRWQDCYRDD
jgi:hypothetical protein